MGACPVCYCPMGGPPLPALNGVDCCSPACLTVLIDAEAVRCGMVARAAPGAVYDEAYFLRGKETGKSLYSDYRWLPELTGPMARRIVAHLGIESWHSVLDYGCARGYTVRALLELGHDAWGYDISAWALANADAVARPRLLGDESSLWARGFDWVIAKDVLEHVPQAGDAVDAMMEAARVGVFAVVPLAPADGEPYVIRAYEQDVTHLHRLTLASWARLFLRPGWTVAAAYRVPGVKGNWYRPGWEWANGFITARRDG